MKERGPDEHLPGQSPDPAPVERGADDLREVWEQGEKLRLLVEEKLSRWLTAGEREASGWAERLGRLRDRLEQGLSELDARVDRVAGRGPRQAPPEE